MKLTIRNKRTFVVNFIKKNDKILFKLRVKSDKTPS